MRQHNSLFLKEKDGTPCRNRTCGTRFRKPNWWTLQVLENTSKCSVQQGFKPVFVYI